LARRCACGRFCSFREPCHCSQLEAMGKKAKEAKSEKKAQLLEGDWISERFQVVLSEVFDQFDVDGDGSLSRGELSAFSVAANAGTELDADEIEQLRQFFETDKNGNLTRKGFFQMYQMQTQARSGDTWKDLKRLGYTPGLERQDGAPIRASKPVEKAAPAAADAARPADQAGLMDELRSALAELKLQPEAPAVHRRVGEAFRALGREEAAAKSFQQAEEFAAAAPKASTPETSIDEND